MAPYLTAKSIWFEKIGAFFDTGDCPPGGSFLCGCREPDIAPSPQAAAAISFKLEKGQFGAHHLC